MTGLRDVLAAIDDGARSVDDLARRTGLTPDLVDLALQQLARAGHLHPETIRAGCAAGGCTSCPAVHGGCGGPEQGLRVLRRVASPAG